MKNKTDVSEYEIWAEYFRVKNELMDLWDQYIESISNMRLLVRMKKGEKRISLHRMTAEKSLMLLYNKGVPAGAIKPSDEFEQAIKHPEQMDVDKYFALADIIRQQLCEVGLYNITKGISNPANSIAMDKSF